MSNFPKHGRETIIGTSVQGRPITCWQFQPPSYAKPKPPCVVFGGIHGDEPASVLMMERLIADLLERPPGRPSWIIPNVNPDGIAAGSKNNAHDVDLNRNFASKNWVAAHQASYHPGITPEDQPETQALVSVLTPLITSAACVRLIAVHATFRVMNWDGQGRTLAEAMGQLAGYPAKGDIGYPTPGSFGSKYGVDLGHEVVTVEVPYLTAEEDAWLETRSALRFAVDLPT